MLISIRLYVQGDDLDPAEVTRLLAVQPARSHRRGDSRSLPDGRIVTEKIGLWVWKAGVDTPDAQLSDVVKILENTFTESRSQLTTLPDAESTWIDVHIVEESGVDGADGGVTFCLMPEHAAALGVLGLPTEITVSKVIPVVG